jgi:hypothetical protein
MHITLVGPVTDTTTDVSSMPGLKNTTVSVIQALSGLMVKLLIGQMAHIQNVVQRELISSIALDTFRSEVQRAYEHDPSDHKSMQYYGKLIEMEKISCCISGNPRPNPTSRSQNAQSAS